MILASWDDKINARTEIIWLFFLRSDFLFSCFTDMNVPPMSTLIAFSFKAGVELRSEFLTLVNPIGYRIFLCIPIRFHESGIPDL